MTKMSEKIAEEILSEGVEIQDRKLDPVTMIMLASAIISLIRLYMECKKSKEEAVKQSRNSGVIENRIVKRELRKQMGTVKYLTQGGSRLANQIITRASKITPQEMEKLYEEAE